MYSANQIALCVNFVFNPRKAVDTISLLRIQLKGSPDANEEQYFWEDISDTLAKVGWNAKHIQYLHSELKNFD